MKEGNEKTTKSSRGMMPSWPDEDDTNGSSLADAAASHSACFRHPSYSGKKILVYNVLRLLALREISPFKKRPSRRLSGANSSRFSFSEHHCEKTDVKQALASWLETDFTRHCKAKYCPLQPAPRSTIAAAYSPDGNTLASTHGDHTVKIICCQTGYCTKVLSGHRRTPWVVRFHPSSSEVLASGSLDNEVRLWDANTAECVGSQDFSRPIASIAFHAQGHLLAVASGHKLYIWQYAKDDAAATPVIVLRTRRSLRAVHFHPHAAPLLLTAEVNDLDSPDCPITVATSPDVSFHLGLPDISSGSPMHTSPRMAHVETTATSTAGPNSDAAESLLPNLLIVEDTERGLAGQGVVESQGRQVLTAVGAPQDFEVPSQEGTIGHGAPISHPRRQGGPGYTPTPAVFPVASLRNTTSQPLASSERTLQPFSPAAFAAATLRPVATVPAGVGDGVGLHSGVQLVESRVSPEQGITIDAVQAAQAALAASQALAELPCTVKLRIWMHDIKYPGAVLDPKACRLTIPHAVLCSEMGAHFSPCGRFLVACVACVLPSSESNLHNEHRRGINDSSASEASVQSPTQHPLSAQKVIYELRVYSVEEATFGQVLASRPVRAAHCLTSIQFSPTSGHILLAYGRRHSSLLRSLLLDGNQTIPVYTILEIYRVPDMELVRAFPSAEDEVNVACFHPRVGGGLVYGTKEGKLRMLSYDRMPSRLLSDRVPRVEDNLLEDVDY